MNIGGRNKQSGEEKVGEDIRKNEEQRKQKKRWQQLICEAWSTLAVKNVWSLIAEIILHLFLFSSTASLAEVYVSGGPKCGSVLAALSRMEELDFGHKGGDVTTRARASFRW